MNIAFWEHSKNSVRINPYKLKKVLMSEGFGQFLSDKDRTSKKILLLKDKNTLKIYDPKTIKKFIGELLDGIDEKEFNNGGTLETPAPNKDSVPKYEVLCHWSRYHHSKLTSEVLDDLPVLSEHKDLEGTEYLKLFTDDQHTSFIRFKNGVVKITKDNIELLDPSDKSIQGNVWESSIIPKDITVRESCGSFTRYVEKAMLVRDREISEDDWTKEYPKTKDTKESLLSLRTALGYLIHSHNTADQMKAIFFIDKGSDLGKPEGGNGKTRILNSLKYFKKLSFQDGKRFRQDLDHGGRFQFADVSFDTKLILIDDLRPDFKFESLFSMITGDMEVEGKGTNKFTIPEERKPKFAITTNYVLMGTGTSVSRRMHIVEFGDYWNRVILEKESPSDKKHLGKLLFDDNFNQDDWDDFYNFGFRCVQDYFKHGLVQADTSNYFLKALRLKVEGVDGDGTVTGWMNDWILTRNEEIFDIDLYDLFIAENPMESLSWDSKRFSNQFFKFVMEHPDYDYNAHLSHKGDSKTQRRQQLGKRDQQQPHIVVTVKGVTPKVKGKSKTSNGSTDTLDVENHEHYFKRLAS
jgi:hypothetical protein